MSLINPNTVVTEQRLSDFYQGILPYLGGIVSSKAGFTPIGTIISVMGTTAPVNYLACDGTVYNIADYVELANYFNEQFGSKNFFGGNGTTTFAVPDLRGEFLRGTGTNSHTDQGSGSNVGVHQDATMIPMPNVDAGSSNLYTPIPIISGSANADSSPNTWADGTAKGGRRRLEGYQRYDDYTAGSGGAMVTTRPTNTSVLYCIATKNFYIDPTLDYSTDEKIIGTWLNGESIFQKTITGTLPAITQQEMYDNTLKRAWFSIGASIDAVIDVKGFAYLKENDASHALESPITMTPLTNNLIIKDSHGVYSQGQGIMVFTNRDADHPNTLRVENHNVYFSDMPFMATLQYIKTTD